MQILGRDSSFNGCMVDLTSMILGLIMIVRPYSENGTELCETNALCMCASQPTQVFAVANQLPGSFIQVTLLSLPAWLGICLNGSVLQTVTHMRPMDIGISVPWLLRYVCPDYGLVRIDLGLRHGAVIQRLAMESMLAGLRACLKLTM